VHVDEAAGRVIFAHPLTEPAEGRYRLYDLIREHALALAADHATQAERFLRQALEILQRIGAPEAPDVLAELDALTDPRSAQ